ncbi:MAG: hypothetical protein AAF604_07530 [Acidobacteriota bacterium]
MRTIWAFCLALALVFASSAELVGHDHAAGADYAVRHCAADHDSGLGEEPGAGWTAAGDSHEHRCLGCRMGAHRLAAAPGLAVGSPASNPEVLVVSGVDSWVLRPWSSHTNRGPPPH